MINLDNIKSSWQKTQRDLITAHGQYVTIYYKPTVSGTASGYDNFFGESMSPMSPEDRTGVTTSTGTAFVVSGIIYNNPGGMKNEDGTQVMPIGKFEPNSVLFTCLDGSATVSGVNKFDNCKYVVLSNDSTIRYQVLGEQKDGLVDTYVRHVFLGRSTVESNS